MQKPNDYDSISAYGDFTPLKLGGHVCKIMQVKELMSKTNKPMLEIYLEIAEGEQQGYFGKQYAENTKDNKKWGCIYYQLTQDYENPQNTHRGLKTFITAVEKSNNGFSVIWGDRFCDSLFGKLVGGVFGREQYANSQGDLKWSTKCVQFRSVEAIRNGVDVPDDKYLQNNNNGGISNGGISGFSPVNTGEKMPWE